jgi:hypothetical protein
MAEKITTLDKARVAKELSEVISLLQENVERVGSGAQTYYDYRRELVSDHRSALLSKDAATPGIFEESQSALIEHSECLRLALCDLGSFSQAAEALRLLMDLRNAGAETEHDRTGLRVADPFRIAA